MDVVEMAEVGLEVVESVGDAKHDAKEAAPFTTARLVEQHSFACGPRGAPWHERPGRTPPAARQTPSSEACVQAPEGERRRRRTGTPRQTQTGGGSDMNALRQALDEQRELISALRAEADERARAEEDEPLREMLDGMYAYGMRMSLRRGRKGFVAFLLLLAALGAQLVLAYGERAVHPPIPLPPSADFCG